MTASTHRGCTTASSLSRRFVVLGVLLLALEAEAKQVRVPPSIDVDKVTLRLNGAAVQKFWFWDIYVVALYLETPSQSAEEILASDQRRCVYLRLLRDVPKEKLRSALEGGFRRNNPDTSQLEERLSRLLAAIPDARKGETILIYFVPGQGTRLQRRDGSSVLVPGKDFANAMFSLWLGTEKSMARIRNALLAGDRLPALGRNQARNQTR